MRSLILLVVVWVLLCVQYIVLWKLCLFDRCRIWESLNLSLYTPADVCFSSMVLCFFFFSIICCFLCNLCCLSVDFLQFSIWICCDGLVLCLFYFFIFLFFFCRSFFFIGLEFLPFWIFYYRLNELSVSEHNTGQKMDKAHQNIETISPYIRGIILLWKKALQLSRE